MASSFCYHNNGAEGVVFFAPRTEWMCMYAYCLFCRTQRARAVARLLGMYGVKAAFTPMVLQHKRVKGEIQQAFHDLLPGYVFLFTDEPLMDFSFIYRLDGPIRWLGDADRGRVLEGPDEAFALGLYEKNGLLGVVKTFREGERVVLNDPLFDGMNGVITKLERNKGRACVAFDFDRTRRSVWVAVDILEGYSPSGISGG